MCVCGIYVYVSRSGVYVLKHPMQTRTVVLALHKKARSESAANIFTGQNI